MIRQFNNHLIPCGIGAIFISTSSLKALELFYSEFFLSWGLMLVFMEVTLGLFLLAGLCGKRTRSILLAVLVVFAIHSTFAISQGHLDCGCFGVLAVPPQYSLVINCLMLTSVVFWKPVKPVKSTNHLELGFVVIGIYSALICIALPNLMMSFGNGVLVLPVNGPCPELMPGQLVRLNAETWAGYRAPILEQVNSPVDINEGPWVVVLYRPDCQRCKRTLSEAIVSLSPDVRLLVVSLNSDKNTESILKTNFGLQGSGILNHEILVRSANQSIVWLFKAPTWLNLMNGKVLEVGESLDELSASRHMRFDQEIGLAR